MCNRTGSDEALVVRSVGRLKAERKKRKKKKEENWTRDYVSSVWCCWSLPSSFSIARHSDRLSWRPFFFSFISQPNQTLLSCIFRWLVGCMFAAVVIFPPTTRNPKFSQHPTSIWLWEKDGQNHFILVKKKKKRQKHRKRKWNQAFGVLVATFVVCFRMLLWDVVKRVDYKLIKIEFIPISVRVWNNQI